MGPSDESSSGSTSWFARAFLALAALWLVAQGHRGSFVGHWDDAASLPGNICWLLILYCLARLVLDWGVRSVQLARFSREALYFLTCLILIEGLLRAVGSADAGRLLGLVAFFVQPVIVLFGFAALHRRQLEPR